MGTQLSLGVLAMTAFACSFDVSNEGTRFRCEGGDCPLGFECVEASCVEVGSGGGDGGPGLDGRPAPDGPSQDAAVQSCDEQYADVDEFEICSEEAGACEFFGSANGGTCSDLCTARGGDCLASFEADADAACIYGSEGDCDSPHEHLICSCTLTPPPGD